MIAHEDILVLDILEYQELQVCGSMCEVRVWRAIVSDKEMTVSVVGILG